MWDWLSLPIDQARAHEVDIATAWHGRIMVLAWGFLAPLAVMIARFLKILPGQNWPEVLDTVVWWRCHWAGQSAVVMLSLTGLLLVQFTEGSAAGLHGVLGYTLILGLLAQVLLGLFRGTKGGPTAPAPDGSLRGDHYDMTVRRRVFEAVHKALGYGLLVLAVLTIALGLWTANAPIWMWLALCLWWLVLLATFLHLQSLGWAVDTYQAIWGAASVHPGNRRPAPGWGARRLTDERIGDEQM